MSFSGAIKQQQFCNVTLDDSSYVVIHAQCCEFRTNHRLHYYNYNFNNNPVGDFLTGILPVIFLLDQGIMISEMSYVQYNIQTPTKLKIL